MNKLPPINKSFWVMKISATTLGETAGDLLSMTLGLGFAGGACLIGALLVAVTLAVFYTSISKIFLFWLAFVLTRPFGATMGDVLTKTTEKGGLNLGTIKASMILAGILVLSIACTMLKKKEPEPIK